jgi:hypothetical protein
MRRMARRLGPYLQKGIAQPQAAVVTDFRYLAEFSTK